MLHDSNNLKSRFCDYLLTHTLSVRKAPTLLAVSGGIDSIVLAHLFSTLKLPFAMAYCHFGLRPEADEEQRFVKQLAENYNVRFYTKTFDVKTYMERHKVSLQMAARELRYAWFDTLLDKHGYHQLATAHHLNDVIETFFRNLTKGTGIRGLRGIHVRQGRVIRPLLFAKREEITEYAHACKLSWREDSSNATIRYDRNFIRHRIIPQLKALNPSLETTFETTLTRLQQVGQLFEEEVSVLKQKMWSTKPPYHHIQVNALFQKPWAGIVLESWLAPFGFYLKQLQPWLENPPQPGKRMHSPTHWLLADRGVWILGDLGTPISHTTHHDSPNLIHHGDNVTIQESKKTLQSLLQGTIHPVEKEDFPNDPYIANLDFDKLAFPLQVRPWQEGDAFYPFTRKKRYRKKISDLLIDAKVPRHKKKEVHVLLSGQEIVWVIGFQIDDRFKVTKKTKKIFRLEKKAFSQPSDF